MEGVTVNFKYSQAEYVKGARQYLSSSSKFYKFHLCLMLLCFAFSIYLINRNPGDFLFISFFILAVIALAMSLVVHFYIPKYNFKNESKFQKAYSLTFAPNGITFVTESINSKLGWDVYNSLKESEDFFYLIRSRQQYTIIPKRAFASKEQQTFFVGIVENALSKKV